MERKIARSLKIVDSDNKCQPFHSRESFECLFLKKSSSFKPLCYIAFSKSLYDKLFWILVIIITFIGFLYYIYAFLKLYFQFPVMTTIHVETKDKLVFPAVTICNLNRMKKFFQNDCKKPDCLDEDGDGDVISIGYSETKILLEDINYLEKKKAAKETKYKKNFLEKYLITNAESRKYCGHRIQNFIISCNFYGLPCYSKNFRYFQSLQYGNCYTFNGDFDNPIEISSREGKLKLELNLEIFHYLNITPSIGARIVIHDVYETPNPEDSGFNIYPGFETSVALERVEELRLPFPYRDNCRDYRKEKISRNLCIRYCIQNVTYAQCSCTDPAFAVNENLKKCDLKNQTDRACMNQAVKSITNKTCDCPLPCLSTDFKIIQSHAIWPSKTYFQDRMNRKVISRYEEQKKYFQPWRNNLDINHNSSKIIYQKFNSVKDIKKDYLKLNIYYRSMDIKTYLQKPVVLSSEFFSQLGGQMSLWLGISIMALFEFMEYFSNLLLLSLFKNLKSFFSKIHVHGQI